MKSEKDIDRPVETTTDQAKVTIDQAKAEAFANRMMNILNDAAIALMISVGHRTHLFDRMANMPPSTSQQIADTASLNERYVREWLGAMVAGAIVDYDPQKGLYHLPPEYAGFLMRVAAPNNMAAFAQYIAVAGSVEDKIVDCFYKGGGVPYSAYPRFQDVMIEDSGQTVVPALLELILPTIPGLIDRLKAGIDVLDIGCGSGRALNLMAKTFPNSRFTGYDISDKGITTARAEAQEIGLQNIIFEVKDTANLNEHNQYDFITTFDAIHDQAKPAQVLKNIANSLRSDGVYLMQDIRSSIHVEKNKDHIAGPFLYAISCMHCMAVSLAAGGPGLGAMWGEETALTMLTDAGFANVEIKQLPHDVYNSYYIIRK